MGSIYRTLRISRFEDIPVHNVHVQELPFLEQNRKQPKNKDTPHVIHQQ